MKHLLLILIMISIGLSSCDNNPHDVDVSGIEIQLKVKHFDQDLFGETKDWKQKSRSLSAEYGDFYINLTQMIPNLGDIDDPAHYRYLESFASDPDILDLQKTIEERLPNRIRFTSDFVNAFRYYRFHFPNRVVPELIYFNSALNASPLVNDTQMGVGLDLFLGSDFELYDRVGYPQYLSSRMKPEYLVHNSMRGWLISEFPKAEAENLLDDIIWEGKILYAMDAMFPFDEDSLKIEYKSEQIAWCKTFEANVWAHFIEKELLYETSMAERMKYLNEGPFTSGFAKESPARVGKWLGWQIVRAYMKENQIKLSELFALKDAQAILRDSKYKPTK